MKLKNICLLVFCFIRCLQAMEQQGREAICLEAFFTESKFKQEKEFINFLPQELVLEMGKIGFKDKQWWYEATSITHNDTINTMWLDEKEQKLVTSSDDKTVRISDVHTGQTLFELEYECPVYSLCMNKAGTKLFTGLENGKIKLLDLDTEKDIFEVDQNCYISHLLLNKSETNFITASGNGQVSIWDAKDGKQLSCFKHPDWITSVVLDVTETKIITASGDGTVRISDAQNGTQLCAFNYKHCVLSAMLDREGKRLVTSSIDNTACIWDVQLEKKLIEAIHNNYVCFASFDKTEKQLITVCKNGIVSISDSQTGDTLSEHKYGKYIDQATLDATKTKLIMLLDGLATQVIDIKTDKKLFNVRFDSHCCPKVLLSKTGKILISTLSDKTVCVSKKYKAYPIDQIRLLYLLYLWISVKKPIKTNTTIDLFIEEIATALAPEKVAKNEHSVGVNKDELFHIWDGLPVSLRHNVWYDLSSLIQKYGH